MSGTESHGGDTSPTCQPRVSRIHSVGLPTRTSLLPEPPPSGNNGPPPLPRRHSATPTVAPPPIPLRPPAIPKRSKNEKPIPVQVNRRKVSDPTSQSASVLTASWSDETASQKLIDLGPFRSQEHRPSQEYSLAFEGKDAQPAANGDSSDFVADFESATFESEAAQPARKSSFEDLQTASRDLEKSLRMAKSAETKFKDVQGSRGSLQTSSRLKLGKEASDSEDSEDSGPADSNAREKIAAPRRERFHPEEEQKFQVVLRPRRETDRRSKFEELQAASKNLERRLHETIEEDEHLRLSRDRTTSRYEEFHRGPEDIERRFHPEHKLLEQSGPRAKYEVDMERARNILQHSLRRERATEKLEKLPKATQTNLPPPLSAISQSSVPKPISVRQDSNVSSDSFSQTSSPSYTNKTMEAPLLPQRHGRLPDRALVSEPDHSSGRPITKSTSTPASLQTIVRMHGGNNGSLHHKIIRDMTSSHYVTSGRIKFRYVQVLVNAVALLAIAGGLAAYFKSYPETIIRLENTMTTTTERIRGALEERNPAPGICLPVIVTFCQTYQIPYNFTVFPNYIGNIRQHDAQYELEPFGPVVNVRCYELAALFLCSVFAPKCGSRGHVVRPCRTLCHQFNRRCGFFLGVFGLALPDLDCNLFPDTSNPDECVGYSEVREAAKKAEKPVCTSGFQCDATRCIPVDWRCDGHLDCADSTDEIGCGDCNSSMPALTSALSTKITKGPILAKNSVASLHCGERRCMFASHVCDGVMDCPWGQDERFCLKLSQRNGDLGDGRLEVYHAEMGKFMPACISHWASNSKDVICSMLGYTVGNESKLFIPDGNLTQLEAPPPGMNLLKGFQECITDLDDYPKVDLTCSGYACGRRRTVYGNLKVKTRIVGGVESAPGDWPFLAALLGGPEQIFYCAGVLIADQWVLSASHCVGNISHTEVNGWTIQLGITRRHTHTYLGQKLKVKRVVPHPAYIFGVHDNDVALFQLEKRVHYHEHLRPVCLPPANSELKAGTLCTVIGWGKKNDTDYFEYEPAVNEVQVPVLNRKVCNSWLAHKEVNVTDGMICAGFSVGGKDACQGDSGGPLLCQDENDRERWFVGGIVSWGIKCAHPKLPGVYAYVPKYVPWINSVMAEYSDKVKG